MDEEPETSWERSARAGDVSQLRELVAESSDSAEASAGIASAMQTAAEVGQWEVVQCLTQMASSTAFVEGAGEVVLQHATLAGRLDIVKALVNCGTPVHTRAGSNALRTAAATGQFALLEYLTHAGADLQTTGAVAACAAAKAKHWAEIRFILDQEIDLSTGGAGMQLLALAAAEGQDLIANKLQDKGVDFKADGADQALLSLSSTQEWERCRDAVKYLVSIGVGVKSHAGSNALVTAAMYGDLEMLHLLVDGGVDVASAAGGQALANSGLLGGCSAEDVTAVADFLRAAGAVAPPTPTLVLGEDF